MPLPFPCSPPPTTSCSSTPIWPPNLDRYLLLSSSYRLRRCCGDPPPPRPPTLALPLKYTSLLLCWISLVKLCKHIWKRCSSISCWLLELPVSFLQQTQTHQRPVAQGHIREKLHKVKHIHSLVPTQRLGSICTYQVLRLGQLGDQNIYFKHSRSLPFLLPHCRNKSRTPSFGGKTR